MQKARIYLAFRLWFSVAYSIEELVVIDPSSAVPITKAPRGLMMAIHAPVTGITCKLIS